MFHEFGISLYLAIRTGPAKFDIFYSKRVRMNFSFAVN